MNRAPNDHSARAVAFLLSCLLLASSCTRTADGHDTREKVGLDLTVLDSDGLLDVDGLPPEIAATVSDSLAEGDQEAASGADLLIGRPLTEVEKYYIQRALELTDGNREEAAKMLKISLATLYRKLPEPID